MCNYAVLYDEQEPIFSYKSLFKISSITCTPCTLSDPIFVGKILILVLFYRSPLPPVQNSFIEPRQALSVAALCGDSNIFCMPYMQLSWACPGFLQPMQMWVLAYLTLFWETKLQLDLGGHSLFEYWPCGWYLNCNWGSTNKIPVVVCTVLSKKSAVKFSLDPLGHAIS